MGLFRYGVASGDPDTDRVVVWTRVSVDDGHAVHVSWRVAEDPSFESVIASGESVAEAANDHTVSVDVTGLRPGTNLWFDFGAEVERSPVGRTRTLPGPDVDHMRFAVVSCAKFNSGFFNGYARIAERDDLDFVLHLGDYIYEASQTPPASQTPGADIGRPFDPLHECRTLADYRRRYAQYRADPDTLAMHHAHPILATLDDHELADGAWRDGADEHRPERDGPWAERRAAAFQARREWLPQRLPDPSEPDRVFRRVSLGGLADLFLIDTRSRRDKPTAGPEMSDPARSQLGAAQRQWLFDGIEASRARWLLLANTSVMSHTWAADISAELLPGLRSLKLVSADGGPDPDQWDGYPHEREQLLKRLEPRDTVVLSGDVHVAMAIELAIKPGADEPPVAAEFVTASLTSQNLDEKQGWGYRSGSLPTEAALRDLLPALRWCDLDSHGYMVVDVSVDRVQVEHWFVDGVLARSPNERLGARWVVRPGSSRIEGGPVQ